MGQPCTLRIKNNTDNALRVEWESSFFPAGIGGGLSFLKPAQSNELMSKIIHHKERGNLRYIIFELKIYEYNFEYPIKYDFDDPENIEPVLYKEKPITYIGELKPSFFFSGRDDSHPDGDDICYEIEVVISISGGVYTYFYVDKEEPPGQMHKKGELGPTSPNGLFTRYVPYSED